MSLKMAGFHNLLINSLLFYLYATVILMQFWAFQTILFNFDTSRKAPKNIELGIDEDVVHNKSKHPCTKRVKKFDKYNYIMYIFISKNTFIRKFSENNLNWQYK